ncbi:MAG: ABC transporter ATP-binding protein [Clostridia bacterium]
MENNLEVKNLRKKYNGFELKDINLELPKGMIMGLIGENGAGKTTTIKSILNLIKIDKGEIKIFGLILKKMKGIIKEDIGVVLDDGFFSEYLNPADINKIMRKMYKNWDEKLYFKYLEDFKLPKNKISKEFSSGMKMKLKIAVALSHHPKLLILDEPTSGLDPVARSEILDIFQDFIQNEDNSIFVSSHITSDLEHIADYITFINEGKIVLSKTRDELLEMYGIVKCSKSEFEKINKNDYVKFKVNRYEYDVLVEDKSKFKRKYDFKIIDKPTLDDIMLIYIKGEKSDENY